MGHYETKADLHNALMRSHQLEQDLIAAREEVADQDIVATCMWCRKQYRQLRTPEGRKIVEAAIIDHDFECDANPWKRRQKELEDELREMKLEIGRLYDSTAACADLRQKIISLKEQLAEVKDQLAAAHDASAKWMLECDAQRQSVDNAALRIKKLKQEVEDSLQQEDERLPF